MPRKWQPARGILEKQVAQVEKKRQGLCLQWASTHSELPRVGWVKGRSMQTSIYDHTIYLPTPLGSRGSEPRPYRCLPRLPRKDRSQLQQQLIPTASSPCAGNIAPGYPHISLLSHILVFPESSAPMHLFIFNALVEMEGVHVYYL